MESSQHQQNDEEDRHIDVQSEFTDDNPNTQKIMEKYNPFTVTPQRSQEITITVSDPIKSSSGISTFYTYNVKGQDKNGTFDVKRRFNEFFTLRGLLVQRWPGCFIPSIPSKKTVGNKDEQVVEDRKRMLSHFCTLVAERDHIYYSQEFQFFLRSNEQDVRKSLLAYPKQTTRDIVEKYKAAFPQLNGKEINEEVYMKISSQLTYLQKARNQLLRLREECKNVARVRKNHNQTMSSFFEQLIPDYEKYAILENCQNDESKVIFTNEKGVPRVQEIRKTLKETSGVNSVQYMYDLVAFEYRDGEALAEAVSAKNTYEKKRHEIATKLRDQQDEQQQLNSGKKTLKSYFTKGNIEEQKVKLEASITELTLEQEQTSILIDMITGILGFIEIEDYRKNQQRLYQSVMKAIASLETVSMQNLLGLWSEVGSTANNMLQE